MEGTTLRKNWWVAPALAVVLAVAVLMIAQRMEPVYQLLGFIIGFGMVGIAFYWAYTQDRDRLWWAMIVGLAAFVLVATGIVSYLLPKDASNSSPYGVITMGLGALVIGLLLKRPTAKFVLYVIAMIILLVGILMLPLALIWKIVLIVAELAVIGLLAWRSIRRQT